MRYRLTGEWAIDAADASGTLLFDVARRRWSDEVLDALEHPRRVASARERVDRDRRSGRPAGRRAGRRRHRTGHGLRRPRDLRSRPGRPPRVRPRRHGSGSRVLSRGARAVGGDGRDAERRRGAPVVPRRPRARCVLRRADGRGRDVRRRVPTGFSSSRTSRASGPRTPTPARRARSRASRFVTVAPRSRAPSSRGSPTGCGTRSSSCGSSASSRGRDGPRAGARTAACGSRSSRRCSICPSSAASSTRARRTARRCSRVSPTARSPPRRTRSLRASACATPSSRTLPGRGATRDGYARYRALYPALRTVEEASMRLEGKVAFVTGRESWHRSRGRPRAVERGRLGRPRVAQRRRPRARRARSGSRVTSATWSRSRAPSTQTVERFGRLDICVANAGVGSYHTLVDTPLEHLEEMIDVNLKGTIYAARAADPAPDRERRGRPRHGRVRGRPPRSARRGRLLRVEVRPGRAHARARPRAARARRPLHQRLPGRRRHGLRARRGLRPHARRASRG